MSIDPELSDRVLTLPAPERAELARRLIVSLDPAEADADADRLWESEIAARIEQLDRGEVETIDWREAVGRARAELRRGRPE